MRISSAFKLATGMLINAPQVEAWWGECLWDWLFGDKTETEPIAFRSFDVDNFSDRCTPQDDCWPSSDEWAQLNDQLGGRLMQDVEPWFAPCHSSDYND